MSYEIQIGSDFKLLIGEAPAVPALEVTLARDVSFDPSWREISASYRGAGNWYRKRPGFGEWSATFDMVYDASDTTWTAIQGFFQNRTKITVRSLGENGEQLNGSAYVQSWTQGEPLEDVVTTSITLLGDGTLAYTAGT